MCVNEKLLADEKITFEEYLDLEYKRRRDIIIQQDDALCAIEIRNQEDKWTKTR